jgi:hypothetical protein
MDERTHIRLCQSCKQPGLLWGGGNPGVGKQVKVNCVLCGEPGVILGTKMTVRCRFRSAEEIGTDMPIPRATD